jgi:hypothetical protein
LRQNVCIVTGIIDSDSDSIKRSLEVIENPKLFVGECKFIGPKVIAVYNNHDDNDKDQVIHASLTNTSSYNIALLKRILELEYQELASIVWLLQEYQLW